MPISGKRITVLTGAGISAESGIPTFRGQEGYWTVGSVNYHPQEMATQAMFSRQPFEVWSWYLYRLAVYRHARPNAGHYALVEMERLLQDRFTLITQNVDNLHLKAGNSEARTFQIHGNTFYMRCTEDCAGRLYRLSEEVLLGGKRNLTDDDKQYLSCPDCGVLARPHVLWFDECYDEKHFKYESSLKAADNTDILVIAGTSGATTLPNYIADLVYHNGGTIIDINIEENLFTPLARNSPNGMFHKTPCSEGLSKLLSDMLRDEA
jgi:NAD-dependent deacetylase